MPSSNKQFYWNRFDSIDDSIADETLAGDVRSGDVEMLDLEDEDADDYQDGAKSSDYEDEDVEMAPVDRKQSVEKVSNPKIPSLNLGGQQS